MEEIKEKSAKKPVSMRLTATASERLMHIIDLYKNLEEQMKQIFGTKVSIHPKKNNKGKIEIEYYSQDELERIVDMIRSI